MEGERMKYIAVIETDEKPVSCEFIGCNGNVVPYVLGVTTNIKQAPELMTISLHGEQGYKDTTITKFFKEGYNQALRDCGVLEE